MILVPNSPSSEEPPNLSEIREVRFKLKVAKQQAFVMCSIPTELLKADGKPMAHKLHAVLTTIWYSGTIPPRTAEELCHPFLQGDGGLLGLPQLPRHYNAQHTIEVTVELDSMHYDSL